MQGQEAVTIETLDLSNQKRINEIHRFSILVLGTMCCICTSFNYAFNLISSTMQKQYNLTQRDLSTISSVGLVFTYFALPYAFLFDYLGPIPVAALATITYPVGSICLALTFMKIIKGSVAKLAVFNAMMGAGSIMYDLMSLMPTISYFPTRKGYVTAVLKTFTGLGQALVGTIYIGFFNKKSDRHLFFLAAFAIVVGVLSMIFMRLPPYHLTGIEVARLSPEKKEKRERTKAQYLAQKVPMWRFIWAFTIIVFLIIYLPVQSVVTAFVKVSHGTEIAFAVVAAVAVGIFCCLCLPWTACCHKGKPIGNDVIDVPKGGDLIDGDGADLDEVDVEVAEIEENTAGKNEPGANEVRLDTGGDIEDERSHTSAVSVKKKPALTELDYIAPQYHRTFFRNLLSTELWAIFWSLFVVVGPQLVVIFNASYILGALLGKKVSDEVRTLLTVINGTGSAIGRAFMSGFEIYTQNRKAEDRIPITIALFFPTTFSLLALILFLAIPGNLALLLPIALIAIGNGIVNSAVVLTTRTIYAKDPAKHYNFCFLAMAFSAIVFMRGLYGEWYSRQAEKKGNALVCYGRNCVQVPLIILTCLCATAFLTNTFVHLRYRAFSIRTLKARAEMREMPAQHGELLAGVDDKATLKAAVYTAEQSEDRDREETGSHM